MRLLTGRSKASTLASAPHTGDQRGPWKCGGHTHITRCGQISAGIFVWLSWTLPASLRLPRHLRRSGGSWLCILWGFLRRFVISGDQDILLISVWRDRERRTRSRHHSLSWQLFECCLMRLTAVHCNIEVTVFLFATFKMTDRSQQEYFSPSFISMNNFLYGCNNILVFAESLFIWFLIMKFCKYW